MSEDTSSVFIEVPAEASFVAVLRTATAVLATRLEFSLDEIDDLRILVDEAASLLLTAGGSPLLRCRIDMTEDAVRFTLSTELEGAGDIAQDGFAWTILRALAHDVVTEQDGREHRISALRRKGPVLDTAM